MEGQSVGLVIAFTAGVLSVLSPCVLPLIPSYVSFISGLSLEQAETQRWTALRHAVLFVTGFTAIFVALGATATGLGRMLNYNQVWLERGGGLLIVAFGLYLLSGWQWAPLARERRIHLHDKPMGYLGSILVGVAFGAGWTPCIGPILGSILLFTSTQQDLGRGVGLLLAYSAGLAIPFLLAAAAVERFLEWFKGFRRYLPVVSRLAGGLLVVMGALVMTGYFAILAGWLQALTPEFLRQRL
ncbi:MAG TPA: cytochrome c biogenesis protein CcdA [Gemmatimonadales bacterium]|nr:cytochrome c biogenesis protein CcdA [Gemmatimonadales bacterium]